MKILILVFIVVYLLPAVLSWVGTKNFFEYKKRVFNKKDYPTFSDAFLVICPIVNILTVFFYSPYIETGIDTSKFFGFKKKGDEK
jgi:hypothetical protein